jgi:hypothetical protein
MLDKMMASLNSNYRKTSFFKASNKSVPVKLGKDVMLQQKFVERQQNPMVQAIRPELPNRVQ